MREIRTSGSMSGKWKRSMVELVRHRQPKAPATDRPHLNHRATSRLYPAPIWLADFNGSAGGKVLLGGNLHGWNFARLIILDLLPADFGVHSIRAKRVGG